MLQFFFQSDIQNFSGRDPTFLRGASVRNRFLLLHLCTLLFRFSTAAHAKTLTFI